MEIYFYGEEGNEVAHKLDTYNDLLEACKIARKYVAKMVADEVNTVVPPSHALKIIDQAIERATA